MDGLKEEEVENEAATNAAFWRHLLLLMEAVLRVQIAQNQIRFRQCCYEFNSISMHV